MDSMEDFKRGGGGKQVPPLLPLLLRQCKLLTAIKEPLQTYCFTACSRSGVNQMWILYTSKELLQKSKSQDFSYEISTLSTTIPYDELKLRLFQRLITLWYLSHFIIHNFFKKKKEIQISSNWETRYVFCEIPL
jgi:hypothetical protein